MVGCLCNVRHGSPSPSSLPPAASSATRPTVIAKAIHDSLKHGNHVTSDPFKAGLAEVRAEIAGLDTRLSMEIASVRTEIANLETRLIRGMVGTVIATATLTAGILRLIG